MFDVVKIGDKVNVKKDAKSYTSHIQFDSKGKMDHLLGLEVEIHDVISFDTHDVFFIIDPLPENDGNIWGLDRVHFITETQGDVELDPVDYGNNTQYITDTTDTISTLDLTTLRFGTQVKLNIAEGAQPLEGWGQMQSKQDEVGILINKVKDQVLIAFPTQLSYLVTSEVRVVGQTFKGGQAVEV